MPGVTDSATGSIHDVGGDMTADSTASAAGEHGATSPVDEERLLSVSNLTVTYRRRGVPFQVLDDVTFDLTNGKCLGIVGESGSGKSTLALTIMGLAKQIGASVEAGQILLRGQDLIQASSKELEVIRRRDFGLIVQDPHSSLDPAFTARNQLLETVHGLPSKTARVEKALTALQRVCLPSPETMWFRYPHELSGGMKQRIVGAIGIVNEPAILIADEPTTALDLTVQSEYLNMLRELRDSLKLAIIFVTHDLGVVAELCDDVMVLYAGRVVEHGPVERIFDAPAHPYTQGLLASRLDGRVLPAGERLRQIPGQPPELWKLPPGCSFAPRCEFADNACVSEGAGGLLPITSCHSVECRVAHRGGTGNGANRAAKEAQA